MDIDKLIDRCRTLEIDHDPEGWPAIQMRDVSALCDALEKAPGLTPKGEPMPQTMEEWKHLASLYAGQIESDRLTISKLKQKINKLEQRRR